MIQESIRSVLRGQLLESTPKVKELLAKLKTQLPRRQLVDVLLQLEELASSKYIKELTIVDSTQTLANETNAKKRIKAKERGMYTFRPVLQAITGTSSVYYRWVLGQFKDNILVSIYYTKGGTPVRTIKNDNSHVLDTVLTDIPRSIKP